MWHAETNKDIRAAGRDSVRRKTAGDQGPQRGKAGHCQEGGGAAPHRLQRKSRCKLMTALLPVITVEVLGVVAPTRHTDKSDVKCEKKGVEHSGSGAE